MGNRDCRLDCWLRFPRVDRNAASVVGRASGGEFMPVDVPVTPFVGVAMVLDHPIFDFVLYICELLARV